MKGHIFLAAFLSMYISTVLCSSSPFSSEFSVQGFALEHHYHSFYTETLGTCLLTCLQDDSGSCKSVSYNTVSNLCKFSSETRYTVPMLFKEHEHSVYLTVDEPQEISSTTSPPQSTTTSPPTIQPGTTNSPITTDTPAQPQGFDRNTFCVDKAAGNYRYPGDCTKYVACVSPTVLYEMACGSTVSELCNYPDCQSAATKPSLQITTQPAQPQSFDRNTFCVDKPAGNYRYPGDCTKYVSCVSPTVLYEMACGSTVSELCNYPECQLQTTESPLELATPAQTTTSESSLQITTQPAQPQSFDRNTFCVDKAAGNYRYPGDCTKYVACVSPTVLYEMACGSTVSELCNYPECKLQTTGSPLEITTPPTTTTESSLQITTQPAQPQSFDRNTFCVDKAAGNYRYPGDCTKYVACVSPTVLYEMACGLTVSELCNYPECQLATTKSSLQITTQPAQPQSFDRNTFCVDKAAGNYRYPGDCTKYVACVSPTVLYEMACGSTVNELCNYC